MTSYNNRHVYKGVDKVHRAFEKIKKESALEGNGK